MTDQSTFNPGFPVYIYEEGFELPKEGTFFLVSGNGLWMHKDTGIVSGFVPVDNISVLQELDANAHVECNLPKVPTRCVWRIKNFFKNVVAEHHAEAEINLYYNKETNDFKIHIPEQTVSSGGVNYKRMALTHRDGMEDYLRVGTIHSHCDFGAFHSGTDIGDEEDFDGLHCTFGHNNKDDFTISASVVVNGHRLAVDPMDVLDGIEPLGSSHELPDVSIHKHSVRSDKYFRLLPVDNEVAEEWNTGLDKWMNQVKAAKRWWGSWSKECVICKGDKVVWAGDCTSVSFRSRCGDGPFEVEEVSGGTVTVFTNVGLARFSEKLFKKV